MANITRDQFVESKNVLMKLLQKGVHLVDADWNEQMKAINTRLGRTLSALVNHQDVRIGNGFKLVGTGANEEITMKAGMCVVHIEDKRAVVLHNTSDYTVTGLLSGDTYYIWIDVWEEEVTSATDPNIVNPTLGKESCVDVRLRWTITADGDPHGAPPTGHAYIDLGTAVSSGTSIPDYRVTNSLNDFFADDSLELSGNNFIRNGLLQRLDPNTSVPFGWTNNGINQIYGADNIHKKFNADSFSAWLGTGDGLQQDVVDYANYKGKPVIVSVWVCHTDTTNAFFGDKYTLTVDDGVGTSTGTPSTPATILSDNTWYKIVVKHNVSSSATRLRIKFSHESGGATLSVSISGFAGYVGQQHPRDYEPHILDLLDIAISTVEVPLFQYVSESHALNTAAVALNNSATQYTVNTNGGSTNSIKVIKIPYYHQTKFKSIVMRFQALVSSSGGTGYVRLLHATAGSAESEAINELSSAWKSLTLDMTNVPEGDYEDLEVEIEINGTDPKQLTMMRPSIWLKMGV